MEALSIGFIISTFVAGIFTFLAPCTLPLVPAYLGFISGVPIDDLNSPEKAAAVKRKILLNGIFFILGFSIVFVVFGTLAGLLGQTITPYRLWFTRIGGVMIIIFGLFMLDILKIPFLQADRHIKVPSFIKVGRPSSSFAVGSIFAFGWTPCVGPILGSVLLLASTSTTASQGAVLLAVFSMGLAVPFILVALAFSKATQYIKRASKALSIVSKVGGIFLILLGILLLTNNFSLLIQYGFSFFEFINYEGILRFL